jgi:hypothetical protein
MNTIVTEVKDIDGVTQHQVDCADCGSQWLYTGPQLAQRQADTHRCYVVTGCPAAEIVWSAEQADQFRQLMVSALGRDCVCEPGEPCWLLDQAISLWRQQALEDGVVAAFAAVQREPGDGPAVDLVYATARALDLDGARVIGRTAAEARGE